MLLLEPCFSTMRERNFPVEHADGGTGGKARTQHVIRRELSLLQHLTCAGRTLFPRIFAFRDARVFRWWLLNASNKANGLRIESIQGL